MLVRKQTLGLTKNCSVRCFPSAPISLLTVGAPEVKRTLEECYGETTNESQWEVFPKTIHAAQRRSPLCRRWVQGAAIKSDGQSGHRAHPAFWSPEPGS